MTTTNGYGRANRATYGERAVVMHYWPGGEAVHLSTACGASSWVDSTCNRDHVTCKRCLASLAKRDRAFQRKARKQFGPRDYPWPDGGRGYRLTLRFAKRAARAIAAEEGRAS
jgi:hypothetical protein